MSKAPRPVADGAAKLYSKPPTGRGVAASGVPFMRRSTAPASTTTTVKLPNGITVEKRAYAAFSALLTEAEGAPNPRAAIGVLGRRLLDLHAAEVRKLHEEYAKPYAKRLDQIHKHWQAEADKDPEIGGNQRDTNKKRLKALLSDYGRDRGAKRLDALQDLLECTGVASNIEFLRFLDWAERRGRPAGQPVQPRTGGAVQPGGRR